jgi:Uma2 family endonuclease
MSAAKKIVSLEEFYTYARANPQERLEFIDGQIVRKSMPSYEHGNHQGSIFAVIRNKFKKKKNSKGEGGWWLSVETSVVYEKYAEVFDHDIVGWKREHLPEEPKDFPVSARPDWVCEVSNTTFRQDTRHKKNILEKSGVPFYWIVDVPHQRLLVFALQEGIYIEILELFKDDGKQKIPPFEAAEFSMAELFGDDPED